MTTRRTFMLALCAGLASASNAGATLAPAWHSNRSSVRQLSGRAFGTHWRVTLPADACTSCVHLKISGIVEKVNAALSPWRLESEISKVNRTSTSEWIAVSPVCSDVVQSALSIAEASDGYFDPTVGALVNRYGFGPIVGDETPDHRLIESHAGVIRKQGAGLTIDPCGIAKGYALDLMVHALNDQGIQNFFLELGGEIKSSGNHPDDREWIAGIEAPVVAKQSAIYTAVQLGGMSLATSGTRHNSYTFANRQYSHIINPRHRQPIDQSLFSVSVLAESAMVADAWSTALMAAGEINGTRLAKANGVISLFLTLDGHLVRETSIGNFNDYRIN